MGATGTACASAATCESEIEQRIARAFSEFRPREDSGGGNYGEKIALRRGRCSKYPSESVLR